VPSCCRGREDYKHEAIRLMALRCIRLLIFPDSLTPFILCP
jgi:hypothetical protein